VGIADEQSSESSKMYSDNKEYELTLQNQTIFWITIFLCQKQHLCTTGRLLSNQQTYVRKSSLFEFIVITKHSHNNKQMEDSALIYDGKKIVESKLADVQSGWDQLLNQSVGSQTKPISPLISSWEQQRYKIEISPSSNTTRQKYPHYKLAWQFKLEATCFLQAKCFNKLPLQKKSLFWLCKFLKVHWEKNNKI
jgi:hypothetical protein